MEDTERLSETLHALLEAGRQERLHSLLEECHPADTAAALRDLPVPHQVTVFRLLNREQAGAGQRYCSGKSVGSHRFWRLHC